MVELDKLAYDNETDSLYIFGGYNTYYPYLSTGGIGLYFIFSLFVMVDFMIKMVKRCWNWNFHLPVL